MQGSQDTYEPNLKLKAAKDKDVKNRERYRRLVGKLIDLSHTRLDIAFLVSLVSQFMHSPGQAHFEDAYRILRYLKKTSGNGILFKKHKYLQIEVYASVNCAGNTMGRRSNSSYCLLVGGNLITWRSKKQLQNLDFSHGVCEKYG